MNALSGSSDSWNTAVGEFALHESWLSSFKALAASCRDLIAQRDLSATDRIAMLKVAAAVEQLPNAAGSVAIEVYLDSNNDVCRYQRGARY